MLIGEEIWKHAAKKSMESLRAVLASVVALREERMIEVESDRGDHFRFWMWPLTEPEIAVCVLALRIPRELALLTDRERECLRCLAQGMSTRDIAEELCIGLTTVHTHLRRRPRKIGLDGRESAHWIRRPILLCIAATRHGRIRGKPQTVRLTRQRR